MSIKINLDKVDAKVVDKYLAKFELKGTGGLNARVSLLEKYQEKETPTADLSTPCTNCGGASDMNLPECPYCGSSDMGDAPTTPPVDPPVVPAVAAPAAPAPAKVGLLRPVKGKGKAKVDPPQPLPPLVVDTSGTELVGATELDEAVDRARTALRAGATSYWDLGRAALDIFERQLWKQRLEAGKQKYTSWNSFCKAELGMSHPNAFSVMDAAKAFSREDFETIGHTKLSMVLRLPEGQRQQILEEAKAGHLPKARLLEIVQSTVGDKRRDTGRGKRGGGTLVSGAKATAALKEKAAARKKERTVLKPSGEVTAVSQLGRTKLKLLARPKKDATGKPARAVSLAQDPWCVEELINGVEVRYTVVKEAAGLTLIIQRSRKAEGG